MTNNTLDKEIDEIFTLDGKVIITPETKSRLKSLIQAREKKMLDIANDMLNGALYVGLGRENTIKFISQRAKEWSKRNG